MLKNRGVMSGPLSAWWPFREEGQRKCAYNRYECLVAEMGHRWRLGDDHVVRIFVGDYTIALKLAQCRRAQRRSVLVPEEPRNLPNVVRP